MKASQDMHHRSYLIIVGDLPDIYDADQNMGNYFKSGSSLVNNFNHTLIL